MPDDEGPLATRRSPTVLGIFAKHPVAGHVKTRLAAAWGPARAAELYAAFVVDTFERFRATADRGIVCYTPQNRESAGCFAELAGGDFELWPQPDQPLGERLRVFFQTAFANGAGRVVVIGSDSPTLPREYVEHAFARLDGGDAAIASTTHSTPADCVLGPATDGGYYLVGLRERVRPIFSGIEWSTSRVLSQTVARLRDCGASLALLPAWYDVDCPDGVDVLRGHLDALRCAGCAVPPRTAALASVLGPAARVYTGC